MRVKLDKGALAPTRAHPTDAGLDLYSPVNITVPSECYYNRQVGVEPSAVIDTGVHVEIPHGYYGRIASKSGLNVKHGLTNEGVIDENYRGSIVVKLYNHSCKPYKIARGDKISQLIIEPCRYEDIEFTDELTDTDRGNNGFGSTGK